MCFVLDVNSFHCFFKPSCPEFRDFEPLHDWLYNQGGTKLVYGGTKYMYELSRLRKYRGYLLELLKIGKFVQIDTKAIDVETERLKTIVVRADFDDAHIVALLAVSGCVLFASTDKRADKYIKRKDLYPKKTPRRVIYRKRRHLVLLTKDKIVKLNNVATVQS
jgi:hypothetical protein